MPGKPVHGWWLLLLNGGFSGLCRKFEAFHNSHLLPIFSYLAAPLILPPQKDPNAAGSRKALLPSALVESKQGCHKQKIQQPGLHGFSSLKRQCAISWDILHCRGNGTAGVVQQQGEGWPLPQLGSSRSLVMSMSHHGDNKDVWWNRTVAIWTRALLRLLFYSSLPRSLGYTTLVWEVFGSAAHPCPVQPQKSLCTSLQLQPITLLPLLGPACASVLRESALQTSYFKYLFKAIGSGAFRWYPMEVSQNH